MAILLGHAVHWSIQSVIAQSKVMMLSGTWTTSSQFPKGFCPFWVTADVVPCVVVFPSDWLQMFTSSAIGDSFSVSVSHNRLQVMHKLKPFVPPCRFRRCVIRFNKLKINEIPCGLIPAMLQFDICFQVRTNYCPSKIGAASWKGDTLPPFIFSENNWQGMWSIQRVGVAFRVWVLWCVANLSTSTFNRASPEMVCCRLDGGSKRLV
jgi:hypothetical protein